MDKEFKQITGMYDALKAERQQYVPLWRDISRYVGISVDPDLLYSGTIRNKSKQPDEYTDDPTAAISVNQFGDYLVGIMWGGGDNPLSIEPSDEVLELVPEELVRDYYKFVTKSLLKHMNHRDAGFINALKAYAYDQAAFGTSGIGAFPNPKYIKGVAHNALIFRQYGVDNICIDEGDNGQIEYVFASYTWRIGRIISEFCCNPDTGEVDNSMVEAMPKEVRDSFNKGDMNKEFSLVLAVVPREDFDPKLKGAKGTKYKGYWFFENMRNQTDNNGFFGYEDFAEKPIAIARMIKLRGAVYGSSSGTMLISAIKGVNFIVATSIEAAEKMANPALGIYSNAILGDGVLDSSPNGLTVFNAMLSGGQQPTFPLFEVGDLSPIVNVIIPYLSEKITTAFKIDSLLDFNSNKESTATEALQRYVIRGKSLSGLLMQQEVECLELVAVRCMSILKEMKLLGVDASIYRDAAEKLALAGRTDKIIPTAVREVMESGKPWYTIKWNNELNKLTRTDAIQSLLQFLQAVSAIAPIDPQIIQAVDWYKLLSDIEGNLDVDTMIGRNKFEEIKKMAAQAQAQAAMLQAGQVQAQTAKDSSSANKQNVEAAKNAF